MDITVERVGNQWHFSDGSVLPVVSGGSDVPPVIEPPVVEPETPPDSLANDFLKNIPDSDKAIVEKYVKDWDAGVTKRFQSIHDEYKPYKELGVDVNDIQQAIQLRTILDENPEYVYNLLKEEFDKQGPSGNKATPEIPAGLEDLPEEFVKQFTSQQQMLESLAQIVLAEREQGQAAQEDAALETELKRLSTKYGDFDQDFVLAKMWHGASGDDAVKAYQTLTQNIINAQSKPKPQPPGLFGGGSLPTEQPDVGKMGSKDIKNFVADILQKAHES